MYQTQHEFWNAPDSVHTPSDTRGKGTTSQGSAQTPEEDWHALPSRDAPTGHWEYDFSQIPYLNTPEGPVFIRHPTEGECQWIGESSPPRDERPVVEPPTQRSEDLWSPPPEQRNTFSWPYPRQERAEAMPSLCTRYST